MTWPQADHADLGLIDDDNTPEMRTLPTTSTAKHLVESDRFNPHEGD